MTRHSDFKQLIRDRMARTGERYTTARAHILGTATPPPLPGIVRGYTRFGGHAGDTGPIVNVLHQAGVRCMEALINGLCGGPGFLYAVFEYKGWPPMLTLALRSRSMPDVYAAEGLARLGVKFRKQEASSPKPARKALEAALDAGKPALCVVDLALLPWYGLPREFAGASPHVVAIAGRDGSDVWIDDIYARPMRMSLDDLDRARGAYRKGKHRMYTIEGGRDHDPKAAIREAIADTARTYDEPAVPRVFAVNCGFSGIEKWKRLLTDTKDAKGWPQVFSDGARAFAGLHRAYSCIEHEFTAPAGGRPFYADFLDEAGLKEAAAAYRAAGALWSKLAQIAMESDPAVKQACDMAEKQIELGDSAESGTGGMWKKRQAMAAECHLTRESARSLYAEMAGIVGKIAEVEQKAVGLLKQA